MVKHRRRENRHNLRHDPGRVEQGSVPLIAIQLHGLCPRLLFLPGSTGRDFCNLKHVYPCSISFDLVGFETITEAFGYVRGWPEGVFYAWRLTLKSERVGGTGDGLCI